MDESIWFGVNKGRLWIEVDQTWLEWVSKNFTSGRARSLARAELKRRREADTSDHGRPFDVIGINADIAAEIIRSGRQKLALKYHPDATGNDGERMKLVNTVADQLLERLKG